MKTQLVDNLPVKLSDAVAPAIGNSIESRIAVAFISVGGISLIEASLKECLRRGGSAEFLVGLDLSVTEPNALWTLFSMAKVESNLRCYCFTKLGPAAAYHPKLYIATSEDSATIVIGSSNLTAGGLGRNIEVNILIRADLEEEIVSDTYAVYDRLKFHPHRVEPDEELLAFYEELYALKRKQERTLRRASQLAQLESRFKDKAASLQSPTPTARDLFGWQRLVFERLPKGQFSTHDVYKLEEQLASHYPENKNVRAKIRPILQQLRDLKLIEHTARGTWVRKRNAY